MIERAIEDWLTSATERYYQLPFAQVLMNRGHEVLYISRHGQGEHGKDIITRAPDGEFNAYQLKRGDISLSDWRAIEGEIRDLVNLPIVHPLVNKQDIHRSFLVTSGYINNPVRTQIDLLNEKAAQQNCPDIGVLQRPELVGMFSEAAGSFLPAGIADLGRFLDVIRADGHDFVDKAHLFNFMRSTFFSTDPAPKKSDAAHAITSSAIVLSYLLTVYQRAENHYALFEAWTVLAATIRHYSLVLGLDESLWQQTFWLARDEAATALRSLAADMLGREDYLEGNPMGDGAFLYKCRVSLCVGAAACAALVDSQLNEGVLPDYTDQVLARLEAELTGLVYIGDSVLPHVIAQVVLLHRAGREELSRVVLERHIRGLVEASSPWGELGVPDPYCSPSEVVLAVQRTLSRSMGLVREFDDELDIELTKYRGVSWGIRPLLHMAARRDLRNVVGEVWRDLSHIQLSEFRPDEDVSALLWQCEHGSTATWFPPEEQSWSALVAEAEGLEPPSWAIDDLAFSLMFSLVYPHRCDARLVRALDAMS